MKATNTKLYLDLQEMHEQIRQIAFKRRVSMAEIIRQAIAVWLEKEGEK